MTFKSQRVIVTSSKLPLVLFLSDTNHWFGWSTDLTEESIKHVLLTKVECHGQTPPHPRKNFFRLCLGNNKQYSICWYWKEQNKLILWNIYKNTFLFLLNPKISSSPVCSLYHTTTVTACSPVLVVSRQRTGDIVLIFKCYISSWKFS